MKTIKSHKETVFAICSLQHELKSSLQALIFSFSGISTTHITDYKATNITINLFLRLLKFDTQILLLGAI